MERVLNQFRASPSRFRSGVFGQLKRTACVQGPERAGESAHRLQVGLEDGEVADSVPGFVGLMSATYHT